MFDPRGHCAKWNKPVTEGQIPHDSTYNRYLKSQIHWSRNWIFFFLLGARGEWEVAVQNV